jgi:hypothetical protein
MRMHFHGTVKTTTKTSTKSSCGATPTPTEHAQQTEEHHEGEYDGTFSLVEDAPPVAKPATDTPPAAG